MADTEREEEIAANRRARVRPDYMGVDCPGCGVLITINNAGGYRTFCNRCAKAMEVGKDGNKDEKL